MFTNSPNLSLWSGTVVVIRVQVVSALALLEDTRREQTIQLYWVERLADSSTSSRHFKQIIFFNSSLQFRNWPFYTSKVRNSLPELNSQCRNWSFYTSKVRNSLPELNSQCWNYLLKVVGIVLNSVNSFTLLIKSGIDFWNWEPIPDYFRR